VQDMNLKFEIFRKSILCRSSNCAFLRFLNFYI